MEDKLLDEMLSKIGKGKGKVVVAKGKIPMDDMDDMEMDEDAEEVKEEAAGDMLEAFKSDDKEGLMDALERFVMACS